ncbi:MAG: hypothetical protein K2M16_08835 [Muribaculaceae bacterium]|nr:hypothetical protein [Muribaculaceae bacterium]
MEEVLVPIFVCVVLPVSIVLIVSIRKWNSDNKRAEILTKAIESGREVDTERLVESLRGPKIRYYSDKDQLFSRLLRGCIFSLTGAALSVVFLTGIIKDKDAQVIILMVGLVCLAVGISYLIVFFASRKDVLKEK